MTLLFSSCSKNGTHNEETPAQSDIELMKIVQEDVLKYFWDYAHPNSKLARERIHENDFYFNQNIVTTGASGFGFLNILMGIENQFITKTAGISHLETALNFLENADRFHGAWPHWMDGNSGVVIPFSTLDNGGDIVETAFLCQALICIREYFKNGNTQEQELAQKADELWKGVEWNWYTNGENVLYWHWSPDNEWQMNFRIEGYNESLIAYIMAISSPTDPISADAYHSGWARNGNILSGTSKYNIPLIFNHNGTNDNVGPLFWAHYSYLALDPRGLTDSYANYWDVVKNHTQIIYQHCIQNPNEYNGYNEKCWGLTASYSRNADGSTGYAAHQPNNDTGVITPSAALSSIPYTPEESIKFLRYLYEEMQDEYIGIAGPYDAFSPHYQWKTPRYLAIDQGTIGPMMENHKTQLFWNLFMNAPEIKQGLINLGFSSTQHGF
ncbi:MAG: glucoamylase family protein [Methylophilaceae bacterium]